MKSILSLLNLLLLVSLYQLFMIVSIIPIEAGYIRRQGRDQMFVIGMVEEFIDLKRFATISR